MPTISIIIPAYNAEQTILETIDSVLKQSFSDFEIIVINDGSTDQTVDLLSTVQDPRLKVFSYSNAGLPTARNRGIVHANGEFISFLDADDLWTKDKLELQIAALYQHPEAGVAYSWTCNMSEDGKTFYPGQTVSYEGNVYDKLLIGNFTANGSNCLVRQQAIQATGNFDPKLKSYEDWDYWLRVAVNWSFVVVPKYQILYRQSSKAMSSKIEVMEKYSLIVTEKAFKVAPPEFQYLKKISLATTYQYLTGLCLSYVDSLTKVRQAAQKLFLAIWHSPSIMLDITTQRYLLKLLLMGLLTPIVARQFFRRISTTVICDPRLQ